MAVRVVWVSTLAMLLAACAKQAASEQKADIGETPEATSLINQDEAARASVTRPSLMESGYESIIKAAEARMKQEPDNWRPAVTIAMIRGKQFRYREALALYARINRQHPQIAEPYIGAGRVYYDLALMAGRTSDDRANPLVFEPSPTSVALLREAKRLLLKSKQLHEEQRSTGTGGVSQMFEPADEFLMMIDHHLAKSAVTAPAKR